MAQFATRVEVNRLCEELVERVEGCKIHRSANLYYVRLGRPQTGLVVLVEWRKLTRARAQQYGMDSMLFERTV